MGWRFLIDENTSRKAMRFIAAGTHKADHVVDVLGPGADDVADILPYANQNDAVIVTKNFQDFAGLDPSYHSGIIIADDLHSAWQISQGVNEIVDQYGSQSAFRDQIEWLDDWI